MTIKTGTQKRIGVILGYLTIIANTLVGILFTPFLIKSLGSSEYAVYKIIASFAGYLNILNFGTHIIIARYVAMYTVNKDKKSEENLLAMMLIVSTFISLIMLVFGAVLYFLIEPIYGANFTSAELALAKKLMIILVLNVILTIIDNSVTGIQVGYEKFIFSKGIGLFRVVTRTLAMLCLLLIGYKAIAIVISDFIVAVAIFIMACVKTFGMMKVKIKYHYFDKHIFKEAMTFSLANVLQAVVNLVNQNLDLLILGALVSAEEVTVYSIALILFTMFGTLSDVMSGIFLPQVTKMITAGADGEKLTDLCISVGRKTFIVSSGAACGFLIFGRVFLSVWMGEGYLDVYKYTLLLIFPMIINFTQGVCVSILNAKLKRLFRSCVLCGVALFNAVFTVILVKNIGVIGAAVATSLSVIIGNIIVMNIYYQKVIKLNVVRMFKGFFKGILPAVLITTVLFIPCYIWLPVSWLYFFLGAAGFCAVYITLLMIFGFNSAEKNEIKYYVNTVLRKLKIKK